MPHHYLCRNPIDPVDRRDGPILSDAPYEEDFVAQVFVTMYPNGATLESVGAVFGVTRERIRQIEAKAIRKLKHTCDAEGINFLDFVASLGMALGYSNELYWTEL